MASGLPTNGNTQVYDSDYYCSVSRSGRLAYYIFSFIRLGLKVLLLSRSVVVVSRIIHVSDNITDTKILQLGSKYTDPNFLK
jgi:hypothetical protein